MKKNLNVIQIKGIRGLIMVALIGSCLAAGFVAFPGLVMMQIWNYLASFSLQVPSIGILQGVLLWGILVVCYFTFRKERLIICTRASEGLSEEELKSVFANIKKQAEDDKFLQTMLKAREAELKIKNTEDNTVSKIQIVENTEGEKAPTNEEVHSHQN